MAESNNWIATGDRSHPTLKLVDELKEQLTYDGYAKDLQKLEDAHLNGEFSLRIDCNLKGFMMEIDLTLDLLRLIVSKEH